MHDSSYDDSYLSSSDEKTTNFIKSVQKKEAELDELLSDLELECFHVTEHFDKGDYVLPSGSNSFDDSLSWDHTYYEDSDLESKRSEALVDSFLQDLQEKAVVSQGNNHYKNSLNSKKNMYDNRIISSSNQQHSTSSYSYVQQSNSNHNSNYNSNNGDTHYNSSYQQSYEYSNNDPNISIGSLRSHDIMEPEDTYEFGTSVKRTTSNQSASRSRGNSKGPSRSGSIRSNHSSMKNGEEYDIITQDQFNNHSRRSSLSRQSESVNRSKYTSGQQHSYSARKYSGEYTSATGGNSGNYSINIQRAQSLPRNSNRKEVHEVFHTSTLPRPEPLTSVTPEPTSEAIVEEERMNADGSTSIIRRVVTATTTQVYHENELPKVEVHISPATETVISPPMSPRHIALNTSHHNNQSSETCEKVTTTTRYENDNRFETEYVENRYDDQISVSGSIAESQRSLPPYGEHSQSDSIHNHSNSSRNNTNIKTTYTENEYVIQNDTSHYAHSSSKASSAMQYDVTSCNIDDLCATKDVCSIGITKETFGEEKHKASGNEYDVSLLDLLMYLKTDDAVLKSNAAGYIMHITYNDDEAKRRIRQVDIIPLLVKLLDHQDEDCHRNAAGALKNLSYGHFIDENKIAIRECGGIAACTRLLYKTSWIEVREHVTGILWNISSVDTLKYDILEEALEAVAVLIVIPLSGWEKELAEMGNKPGIVTWSVLLRNSTGVLRNVSSAGKDAREKMRSIDGLVDSLVWILRASISSGNREAINHKIVENITCTLRNLSYKVDVEVDRNVYPDCAKISATSKDDIDGSNENQPRDSNKDNNIDANTSIEFVRQYGKRGCIGMKKKPFMKRKTKRGSLPLSNNANKKPPPEQWKYLVPVQEHRSTPLGVELLWQQETVTLYIYFLTNSENPITLEASAAAIHNLCGCKWNWAGLLRVHIRLQKGIPPMHDLLSVDQEYVVRSIAYALRNLAIDRTNKWSIGKFAHTGLIQILPPVKSYVTDKKPSEYTINAVLSALQVLVYTDNYNSKYVKDDGGISKLVALTREPVAQKNGEKPLRVYSEKIMVEANRVLLYMWEFKECREAIREEGWSHSKAEEGEKAFKHATTKKKKTENDSLAEMEKEEVAAVMERDTRRYVNLEEDEKSNSKTSKEEYELHSIGYGDVSRDEADEVEPLVRRGSSQKKKKNNWFKSKKDNIDENKKSNLKSKPDEKSKLMNEDEDDTAV